MFSMKMAYSKMNIFLRKIVSFKILFVPNFVDLDLGFGIAFFFLFEKPLPSS